MTHPMLEVLLLGSLLLSAAILLVALLRLPLRRLAGAQAQYQLWLLVPAVLLAAAFAALQPERPVRWQIELPSEELSPLVSPLLTVPASGSASVRTNARPDAPSQAVLLTWLLGVLACLSLGGLAHQRLLRRPRLPAGASAALVGVWRPRLRLPVDFRQRFPAAERRLILLHERLHAERGDTRWLLLALVLTALQWFNPLAWWALHRLRADMELACDADLLRRHPAQLKTYRQALLRAQGLRLPMTATPCSSHPLIERLSMLPTHCVRSPRRGIAALVIGLAAGLTYAAQPTSGPAAAPTPPPALPTPPAVPAVKALAPPVAATTAQAAQLPAPPAPKAKTAPALPAPAAQPAPGLPDVPAPSTEVPMLRTDLKLTIAGQALEEVVLLEAFDKTSKRRFTMPNGQELEVELRGLPADETRFPKDSIQVNIAVTNLSTGKVLFKPRLVVGNGVEASVEQRAERKDGQVDPDAFRIDLMSRKLQSQEADAELAHASLLRDIEAGRAPAPFKR